MPCFHPIPAVQDGKKIILHPRPANSANLRLPCGNCIGCKTARSQEWASRCMHELREHHNAVFATLTYAPEHLPSDGSLVPKDLTDFLKRFRKAVSEGKEWVSGNPPDSRYPSQVRYLACGEYGDIGKRPHYHAILFGVTFNDSRAATHKLFNSPQLERCWGLGTVNYGKVERASAAYVAGYTTKSMGRVHCDDDGVVKVAPFLRCSKGLGREYALKYAEDFRSGCLIVDGSPTRLPRYYKKLLEAHRPDVAEDAAMAQAVRVRALDANHPDRLEAGEKIAKRKRELTRSHSL